VLQALPGTGGPLRVGFTVTKKVGNSVVRNRARRRLREAARLTLRASDAPGWDLVLIAREATPTRDFPALLGDLRGALRQAGVCGTGDRPGP
jgi:ribonuclease P protein component